MTVDTQSNPVPSLKLLGYAAVGTIVVIGLLKLCTETSTKGIESRIESSPIFQKVSQNYMKQYNAEMQARIAQYIGSERGYNFNGK